jgi:hypothetical protein
VNRIRVRGVLLLFIIMGAAGCLKNNSPPPDEIETRVRDILSLPTYEHVYRDVVYVGEQARFLGILTKDKEVLFSIDVNVRAGIDLTEGLDITFPDTRSAVVSLPPAKVLSIDADENTIYQYFVREWGGSLSTLQYYDEINRKKEFLLEDAVSRGILVKAERNAEQLIRNFLGLAGFENIEIRKTRPLKQPAAEGDGTDG